jgi:hypothetical protein
MTQKRHSTPETSSKTSVTSVHGLAHVRYWSNRGEQWILACNGLPLMTQSDKSAAPAFVLLE